MDEKVMSRWTLNENKERARTFGRGNEGVNLAGEGDQAARDWW